MSHTSNEEYLESCRERITAPHRGAGSGRLGRKTGRASNRIKKFVPIRCNKEKGFDTPFTGKEFLAMH